MNLAPARQFGESRFINVDVQIIMCSTCCYFLRKPTTCQCGHTRCLECITSAPCGCGQAIRVPLRINRTVENINETLILSVLSNNKVKLLSPENRIGKVVKRSRNSKQLLLDIKKPVVEEYLYKNVGSNNLPSWLQATDIECAICKDVYVEPVTTPCGHVFCKLCIERHLFYMKTCPLCNCTQLNYWNWDGFKTTKYMVEILKLIGCYNKADRGYFIPILKIAAGYPGVECSVLFKTSLEFLRKLFLTSKKTFGIIVPDRAGEESHYGTVMEIKKILALPNGAIQVAAVGVRRFRLLEKFKMKGYELAHVVTIHDDPLINREFVERFGKSLLARTNYWLSTLEKDLRRNVDYYIGSPALHEVNISNSFNENGPTWLWKLINILPLTDEAIVHLISETRVLTRMRVVFQMVTKLIKVDEQEMTL